MNPIIHSLAIEVHYQKFNKFRSGIENKNPKSNINYSSNITISKQNCYASRECNKQQNSTKIKIKIKNLIINTYWGFRT